ncbi:quinol:electron acceptor oxidoreductase subunit ActD [Planctomycetes bacterium K23_9]|uniref:Cytochrome c n=1 Tax=Stieleria marina TaxID=1930275 RepID=A0A517NRZ1_9BACT|nr:Cytochrome c [Planctomycetes bacterium K23_9]
MSASETATETVSESEKKIHGVTAEFTSVDTLLAACRRVRDAGYTKTDAFAPFAVHGIDKALGIKPTVLPWIALIGGVTGVTVALCMQIWMNAIDYPYIISGKPFISLPAFIPVAFELTILLASFGAFFGMWALNGLPRFSNPMFTNPRFDRVTDDTFFLFVDSKDERFDQAGVERLFADCGGEHIDTVVEDDSPTKVPSFLIVAWLVSVALSIIPLLIVAKMRVTNSSSPRFHIFFDMDFSPARDAQQTTSIFADNRAARPDIPGTVARGQVQDLSFTTGIEKLSSNAPKPSEHLVAFMQESDDSKTTGGAAQKSVMDTTVWLDKNPRKVDASLLERGQQQFGIYCSVCHGMNGGGNGLVNQRAQKLSQSTWIQPSSLHQETLYSDKYPDGKLFSTITNGIRKMPGYAGQIKAKDRWAIVAYVRALQQSQNASIDLVPQAKRASLEKEKAGVEKRLKEEAEEAQKKAGESKKDSPKPA